MTPESLQKIYGNTIFQRALTLYNRRHVLETTRYGNNVYASVRGSQEKIYQVKIELSDQENDFTAHCSCPYPRLCKHSGAVLLLLFNKKKGKKSSKKLLEEIRESQEKFSTLDDKLITLETQNTGQTGIDRSLENYHYTPDINNKTKGHRFRLVFVLHNSVLSDNVFLVKPGLQYIKENGTYGRIETFVRTHSVVPFTDKERDLLFIIMNYHGSPGGDVFFKDLVAYFKDNPDIPLFLENEQGHKPVQIHVLERAHISFNLSLRNDTDFLLKPLITLYGTNNKPISDENGKPLYYETSRTAMLFVYNNGHVFYRQNDLPVTALFSILHTNRNNITVPDIKKLDEFVQKHVSIPVTLDFDATAVRIKHVQPTAVLHLESANINMTSLTLIFKYGENETTLHNSRPYFTIGRNTKTREIETTGRNFEYEQTVNNYIRLFLKKNIDNDKRAFTSINEYNQTLVLLKYDVNNFLFCFGQQLLDNGFEIRVGEKHKTISNRNGEVTYRVKTGIDWFDIETRYQDQDGNEETILIDEQLLEQGIIETGSSYTLITRDEIDSLRKLYKHGLNKNGRMKISKLDLPVIEELYRNTKNRDREFEKAHELAQKLKDFNGIDTYPRPEKFNATLRHYQVAGYNWLQFVRNHKLNACLADDMGLGKTVQTLALLQKCKEDSIKGTTLIIVPVSTIPNWEQEIMKFTSDLTVIRHTGPGRKKDPTELILYDIILTSYHTMRNDIELFRTINFLYVILDEAQNIKNAASQVFKAVKLLKADHRLTLTGTPVENNTMDLWSQMDFLNPGLLGPYEQFRKRFASPIEKEENAAAAERLRRLVFPFLLRRKKEDVAEELPPKEEIVLYTEMGSKQKELYEKHRRHYKNIIGNTIRNKGIRKSSIEIFDALLKLRQIALFPVLAGKEYADIPSCKFDLLKEIVEELLAENHKMLIFSQFVKSLHIIENHIKKNNIDYAYLDGSTKRRDQEIRKFQEDDSVKMFLLSLKAGGVGINLTAADYVLLFDPWWNPATESQAIDRSHRIGQKRKVIAYKMIVRDTVEEKILQLQQKKKKLVEELVTEEKTFFKALDREDVLCLFD